MSTPIKNKDGNVVAWAHDEPGECVEVKTDDIKSLRFDTVDFRCEHDWVGVLNDEHTCLKCHAHRCIQVAKRQVDFHTPNHFRYPSTTEELLGYGGAFFNQCLAIAEERNKRYAGAYDPFKNFRLGGDYGIAIRMTDKVSRLLTLLHPSNTTDDAGESIEDTCKDLANYSMLLSALRANERGGK
jgi:hypothetical protein